MHSVLKNSEGQDSDLEQMLPRLDVLQKLHTLAVARFRVAERSPCGGSYMLLEQITQWEYGMPAQMFHAPLTQCSFPCNPRMLRPTIRSAENQPHERSFFTLNCAFFTLNCAEVSSHAHR